MQILEVTVYTYSREEGLRGTATELVSDLNKAYQWLMLQRLHKDCCGYIIEDACTRQRVDEWWDRKNRRYWIEGDDGEQAN